MHRSTVDAFLKFTEPLEGRVAYMYLDIKELITTGVGNLIDPVAAALDLPWKIEGRLATKDEIQRDWEALKARRELAKRHHKFAAEVTRVRLEPADIDALVLGKLKANERFLKKAFPEWDQFPADAQLGICSMAWALGAGFSKTFKNFARAANQQDWEAAKTACKIKSDDNPGIVPRNAENERCFVNAAFVRSHALPLDALHWPNSATVGGVIGVQPPPSDEITESTRGRVAGQQFDLAEHAGRDAVRDGLAELSGKTSPAPAPKDPNLPRA
jgi:GH24 family phage-related lysozyme (muramidase)